MRNLQDDDSEIAQVTSNTSDQQEASATTVTATTNPKRTARFHLPEFSGRHAQFNMSGLAARLQRIRLIPQEEPAEQSGPDTPTEPGNAVAGQRSRWRGRARKDSLQDWQDWSKFRLWRRTRPLWGSLFMICAGIIMLVGASFFLSLALMVQSLWPALLIGGLLMVMGVIQLFLPSYAVLTGSIGMVLALVSLPAVSFGGCGIGMLLGVIGSALSIAWRPVKRSRLLSASTSPMQ
jgi:hypothetical protein